MRFLSCSCADQFIDSLKHSNSFCENRIDDSERQLNKKHNQSYHYIEEDPSYKVSYEEIAAWGRSFDRLMKSKEGQSRLADFLKFEFSDENILFWQACEELKREKNSEKVEEKARIIYEDFVSILSPKEVSLDSRVREIVNTNMLTPTTKAFDEAQTQIYTLMQRDSYPRFINSKQYRACLQQYGHAEDVM